MECFAYCRHHKYVDQRLFALKVENLLSPKLLGKNGITGLCIIMEGTQSERSKAVILSFLIMSIFSGNGLQKKCNYCLFSCA